MKKQFLTLVISKLVNEVHFMLIFTIFRICELLDGKGAKQGNKFQAKVGNMGNYKQAEKLVKEYFK